MLESEVTKFEVTWFKASLLTTVYAIIVFVLFVATIRLLNDLMLAMVIVVASIMGTLFAAALRPRPELKLWLMLTAVGIAVVVGFLLLMLASDV